MKTKINAIQVSRNLAETSPLDKYAVVSRGANQVRTYHLTGASGLRIYNTMTMVDSFSTWKHGIKYQSFYYKPDQP